MALVLFSFSGLVLEGAGIDWSAIYMRDVFDGARRSSAAWRWPPARWRRAPRVTWPTASSSATARWRSRARCSVVLGLGTLMVTFAPAWPVALLGFALMGVGTSVMFPLAMSAAAQRTDRPAATNVAALAQISFVSFLLGAAAARLGRRAPGHPLDLRAGPAAGAAERGGVVELARGAAALQFGLDPLSQCSTRL